MPATLTIRESHPHKLATPRTKVAYIMSRFPRLTETFVLHEILAVQRQGIEVGIYPLQREHARVVQPEARPLVSQANFTPWISWKILRAHGHFLRQCPRRYVNTLLLLLWANLGSLRYLAGAIAFFPKAVYLARHMRARGIQHIHAHFASHPAAVAWVIHRLTGITYSFTAHGSDLHRDRHMLREKVKGAAFVATISKYNREIIVAECGEKHRQKVEVIHCGVDLAAFDDGNVRHRSMGNVRSINLICIGTLHEVKGQTHLIEACRLLRQKGFAVDCHLVGDGPDRKALQRQAAQVHLSERIHFHGYQPQPEVARLLAQADLLVAPSVPTSDGRREGIPVVLMEAMASGVPVVASRLSGIPELVEDGVTGLLAPPGDPAAIAEAIVQLALGPEIAERLALAARERIELDFNLHRSAARLAGRFSLARAA